MASLAYPFVGLPSDATLHAVPHSAPLLNSKNAASLNLQPREPLAASRHASEWRLTFHTCDKTGELPSKAFMR